MTKNKILVLVCSTSHVITAIPIINSLKKQGNDVVIIGLEYEAQKALESREIYYKIPDDYFTAQTFEDLDEKAISLARKWHKLDEQIEEFVSYQGINLGELIEWEMSYIFSGMMKYIESINSIFNEERPAQVFLVGLTDETKHVKTILEGKDEYLYLEAALIIAKFRDLKISKVSSHQNPTYKPSIIFKNHAIKFFRNFIRELNFIRNIFNDNGNKILFVSPWKQVYSVVEELRNDNKNEIRFFSPTSTIDKNIKTNLLYRIINPNSYKTKDIEQIIETHHKIFNKRFADLKNNESFKNLFLHSGYSFWGLAEDRFSYLFSIKFSEIIRTIEKEKRMFDLEDIAIVVVSYGAMESDNTITAVAKQKGVPTLLIPHGVYGHIVILPKFVEKIAAWGEHSLRWLTEKGIDSDKVFVTGCPRNDIYSQNAKKINSNMGSIVLATQYALKETSFANIHLNPEADRKLIGTVVSAMKHFPVKKLIIKLHPNDREDELKKSTAEKTAKRIGINNISIVKNSNLVEMLNSCDILITPWSGVAFEAMLLDKPVIIIDMRKKHSDTFKAYSESGAVISVEKEEQLIPAIREVLYNKDAQKRLAQARKKFIYDYGYIPDGKASKRVADLIVGMIK